MTTKKMLKKLRECVKNIKAYKKGDKFLSKFEVLVDKQRALDLQNLLVIFSDQMTPQELIDSIVEVGIEIHKRMAIEELDAHSQDCKKCDYKDECEDCDV